MSSYYWYSFPILTIVHISLEKLEQSRWLGGCPIVHGVSMNLMDHPHGGGEGRTKRGGSKGKSMVGPLDGLGGSKGKGVVGPLDRVGGSKGIRGILLNKRNIPIMSMPIESMLLAVNSNFLVFSVSLDDMMGQSFASLVPTVAAAESAIGLRICGTVVESLPMARCAPKCEKTVQALLCRNLNVKSATLPNAISSRRIRLQDDLVTGFHFSVSERFVPGCTLKASIVELIREGLVVLRMVRVGGSLKNKEDE
ncbi:hypothetical protein FEM48_ZijujUnG0014500 [Ziziphus jujuba var. spinosa]|uniref:ATP synthase protein MI25 n=1 Tax=Ziziphus jujuba var. spinosa TaxID=714518 RepID=A0A978U9Y3_ZIZJJ|nr:hypothetical protein FEM48_ZijujUnG0014500 [Ziziphus jujuba var. spinosa]